MVKNAGTTKPCQTRHLSGQGPAKNAMLSSNIEARVGPLPGGFLGNTGA